MSRLTEYIGKKRAEMAKSDADLARRVPPGQVLTKKWPVLTYGATPRFNPSTWSFRCFGRVEKDVTWTWEEFLKLPRVAVVSDVHCVTRWSLLDNRWEGVHVREIMEHVRLKPEAVAVLIHADPDYTTNLALKDLVDDDVLLALKHNGRDLEPDHGGPVRLVVPKFYFWKSAKWVRGFEFLEVNAPGFWEVNGYHMHADPWTEERFSSQETRAMQQMRAEAARRMGKSDR
jgi:DMSO/TMAO reductase YedYZ molybdopterin-dependent catalytic subunit